MKLFFLASVFALLSAVPALAWDDVGHRLTGYIAWQRMSQTARDNVIRILRSAPEDSHLATFFQPYGIEPDETRRMDYFIFVPTWADVVRDRAFERRYREYNRSNWHYADTFWRQVNGTVQVLNEDPDDGGQATKRLAEFDAVVRDPKASNADKAIAIAWIAHLTGDIHQPLHTSARVTETEPKGDQGGNLVILSPAGAKREDQLNLHWFWDSIVSRGIPYRSGLCEREYLEMVAQRFMKRTPFASVQGNLNLGKYEDWQKESFGYINTIVFSPDLIRNQLPSAQYKAKALKLAERQLVLAGYRLGETLNNVFGSPAAPAQK